MRLEIGFSNIQDFEIFSESNSLKFRTQSWDIRELYQENITKPIRWMESNMNRLLGTYMPEGEDTELLVEVCLKTDKFGKNLGSRIQTLDKIASSGLLIKIDGRQHRVMSALNSKASIS